MTTACYADTIPVKTVDLSGPYVLGQPVIMDRLDVNSKEYDASGILDSHVNFDAAIRDSRKCAVADIVAGDKPSLGLMSFNMSNTGFARPSILVEGVSKYNIYLDGKKVDGELKLRPGTRRVTVKYVTMPGETFRPQIKVVAEPGANLVIGDSGRLYTLDDVLHGPRISGATLSPDGMYIITAYTDGQTDGSVLKEWKVTDLNGNPVATSSQPISWMPKGSRWYKTVETPAGIDVIVTDAATRATNLFASNIGSKDFRISPDEKYLVISKVNHGPAEDKEVYRIIEPEDRQPGWRDRKSLELYDIATGITRPLTFVSRDVTLLDISDDASRVLVRTTNTRLSKRPTIVFDIAVINLKDMSIDTLVSQDGFIGMAVFSPDASKVLVSGSPEAFNSIGANVPEGRTPSMTDFQLYLVDVAGHDVKPMTREFNPSVTDFAWNRADGLIYLIAEDRDRILLFTLDPVSGKFVRRDIGQDIIKTVSLPRTGRNVVLTTQSADNPDRLYTLNTRNGKTVLLDEPLRLRLKDTRLAKVQAWDFVNSIGDTICGRFYLPPDFDPAGKYPLIVNYYGGCSPTSRTFESRYPHHAYAAQGYVVYVLEPSGATGFGQEFASRHVNTAGVDPARDIIEGTKKFCEGHPYVDSKKIGCIGASYGGFMTQYLQTVTDIFAAAISHAGISDHTSYWGEGYWGYSYSEVAMANSYPWTRKDLYVDRSPLYNADKIHTPLLFLHGDADHNVPVGESIQMFTALKLLGRPTAFVAVADQDHHIMEHDKRIKWQDTIFAWFAKYLKDQPEWWDTMYPPTSL